MRTYATIAESMKCKPSAVRTIRETKVKGTKNTWIHAKKDRGRKIYGLVRYPNGQYSSAITY